MRLAENTERKKSPKIRHLDTIAQLCRAKLYTYQVTYQVRPHLFRRHSRTSEARGLGGLSVLEVAHPRFPHMLEAVLEGMDCCRVDNPLM